MDKILTAALRAWRCEPTNEHAQALACAVSRSSDGAGPDVKVVISPGFGIGFASDLAYINPALGKFVAEYPALIAAVESGSEIAYRKAMATLRCDVYEKFMPIHPSEPDYLPSVISREFQPNFGDLRVVVTSSPYMITEYDGSEGVEPLSAALDRFW